MIETDVTKNGNIKKLPTNKQEKIDLSKISILDKIRNDPKFTTRRSLDWFKTKISEAGGNSPSAKYELLKTTKDKQVTRVLPGSMYIFKYMPKHADDLPFYDTWPCSLMFSLTPTGMIGINFHYLSIPVRAKLYDKLWQIAMVYRNQQQQCKRITWKFLNNATQYPEIKPAIKQYLYSHLQSKLIKVDIDDWKTAILLPIASFAKKSETFVQRNSMQQIKNQFKRN